MICNTSVNIGSDSAPYFVACGKPITQRVSVGAKVCGYCDKHAADAREYVEKQGQKKIAEIQHRLRVT